MHLSVALEVAITLQLAIVNEMTHHIRMREEYKHSHCDVMGSSDRADTKYVCQNTQLATGISVMHRLVQKIDGNARKK